jgi:hypothetical protein
MENKGRTDVKAPAPDAHPQTYGPFTRCYEQPSWSTLPLAERARLIARQGKSFATALEVRVVYPPKDGDDEELVDVPWDGRTVGEIVTRGNIVMKEVRPASMTTSVSFCVDEVLMR